jgi:predicted  nucleic acid-binding Zn-ribbon protein
MEKFDMLLELQKNYDVIKESSKEMKDGSFIYLLKKLKDDFESSKIKLKKKEGELAALKKKYREINDSINGFKKELEKSEYQLYNNAGSDIKLIEGLQKKAADMKQSIGDLDSQSLELLELEEKLSSDRDKLKLKLTELKEEFESVKDTGSRKINHAKEEISRAQEKVDEIEKQLPEQTVKRFNMIREAKGSAVSKHDHGVCQGCKMKISAITMDKINKDYSVVFCDNCGRILHCSEKDSRP